MSNSGEVMRFKGHQWDVKWYMKTITGFWLLWGALLKWGNILKMNLVSWISPLLLCAPVIVSKKPSILLVRCVCARVCVRQRKRESTCVSVSVHEHAPACTVCLCTCEVLCVSLCVCVCVPLCTLAVIIVSNNPNEERGTGCVHSSNYKLISYHVVGSN